MGEIMLMKKDEASAFLYSNGNALFFNSDGEQNAEMQMLGLCGLHQFVKEFPDAKVYWSIWRERTEEIPKKVLPYLLRCLREVPKEEIDANETQNC